MKFLVSLTAGLLSIGLASASPAAPLNKRAVSTDGSCGGTKGFTCKGSSFGNCCSQYGWCGSSVDHCGASCNSAFGTCTGTTTSKATSVTVKPSSTKVAPAPSSAPTKKVSPDATCGGANGYTCLGFAEGNCCSANGWCGSTSAYVSIWNVHHDWTYTDSDSVEAVANLALETAAATPAQDPAQSKAALARLPQQPHHQQHLDLLSNA